MQCWDRERKGRTEGHAEGHAEGLAAGQLVKVVNMIRKWMNMNTSPSIEVFADMIDVPVHEVERTASMIAEHPNLSDMEIAERMKA